MEYKNSFIITDDPKIIDLGRSHGVTEFNVATSFPDRFVDLSGVTTFKTVHKSADCNYPRLYLQDLTNDNLTDAVAEAVLSGKSIAICAAAYSLDESGAVDVKYCLSPIQLLHKLGLLDGGTVVGGVYLDRDDVDLMAQSEAKLILCPSASMGYGYGIPHYTAYIRKLSVSLGSGDNRFNHSGDMLAEARALVLGCNSEMRDKKAVDLKSLFKCFSDTAPIDPEKLIFG